MKGFTLIEILVAITIISVLASVSVTQYRNVRLNARDQNLIEAIDTTVEETSRAMSGVGKDLSFVYNRSFIDSVTGQINCPSNYHDDDPICLHTYAAQQYLPTGEVFFGRDSDRNNANNEPCILNNDFVYAAPMNEDDTYYCVDSSGFQGRIDSRPNVTGPCNCQNH